MSALLDERRLLEHHLDGNVENFTVYDEYSTIYPKAFVALTEGAVKRMRDGNGRIVAITNPGCNTMQIPRVGYDMPGQAKATMEWLVRMYALRLASRRLCVNAVSHQRRSTTCTHKPLCGAEREARVRSFGPVALERRRWLPPLDCDSHSLSSDHACGWPCTDCVRPRM